jgi:hypothetical protein
MKSKLKSTARYPAIRVLSETNGFSMHRYVIQLKPTAIANKNAMLAPAIHGLGSLCPNTASRT